MAMGIDKVALWFTTLDMDWKKTSKKRDNPSQADAIYEVFNKREIEVDESLQDYTYFKFGHLEHVFRARRGSRIILLVLPGLCIPW